MSNRLHKIKNNFLITQILTWSLEILDRFNPGQLKFWLIQHWSLEILG